MRRVLILGSPGAGKSTFARRLSERTGLPLIHLDQLYWQPNWIERAPHEWEPQLLEVLSRPAWIIDGNYGRTLPMRLEAADTAILLDLPTRICLARACRRIVSDFGRVRSDMSPGCPERFDPAFIRYILTFRRDRRPAVLAHLNQSAAQKIILTTPKQVKVYLESLTTGRGRE